MSISIDNSKSSLGFLDHFQRNGRNHPRTTDGADDGDRKLRPTWSQPLLLTHVNTEGTNLAGIRKNKLADSGTMYRKDVFYQGSLMNIPRYTSKGELSITNEERHTWQKPIIDGEEVRSFEILFVENWILILFAIVFQRAVILGCIPCSIETKHTFNEIMDFSIFQDMIFIIFTLSNFLTSVGFNVPYVFLVPLGTSLGIENPPLLLSAIGMANTVGRIVLGYFSDKPYVNRLLVYNICLTVCGICKLYRVRFIK